MEKDVLKEEKSSYFVSPIGMGRKVLTASFALKKVSPSKSEPTEILLLKKETQ